MVSPTIDVLINASEQIGAARERARICRIVGSLPVAECACDQQWLEVGIHFVGCMNQAEIAFRARLLDAIVPTVDEGSGNTPLSGVPEPRGDRQEGKPGRAVRRRRRRVERSRGCVHLGGSARMSNNGREELARRLGRIFIAEKRDDGPADVPSETLLRFADDILAGDYTDPAWGPRKGDGGPPMRLVVRDS